MRRREILVIYRLKFKSEHDFEKAVQTLQFGQNMGKYLESLQRSFGLQRSQPNYPMVTPPEINFCKEDLIIYVCSYEVGQYVKGSRSMDILREEVAERMARLPYYYEVLLKSTFGSTADIKIATGEHV
jgi:hypothetical protein